MRRNPSARILHPACGQARLILARVPLLHLRRTELGRGPCPPVGSGRGQLVGDAQAVTIESGAPVIRSPPSQGSDDAHHKAPH